MLMIEELMKMIDVKLPTIYTVIDINENGYRIVIKPKYGDRHNHQYHKERKELIEILSKFKDLYIIKICAGMQYIVKLMYIKKVFYYLMTNKMIIQSTNNIYLNNVFIDDIHAMETLNIEVHKILE